MQVILLIVPQVYPFVPTGSHQIKPNEGGCVLYTCFTVLCVQSDHSGLIPYRSLKDFLVHGPHPLREDLYVPNRQYSNSVIEQE